MFTQPGTPGHTQPKYGDLWPFTGALLGAFPSRCPQPIGVHAGLQPSLSHPPEQNRSVRSPKMGCFSLENSHGQRDMFFFCFFLVETKLFYDFASMWVEIGCTSKSRVQGCDSLNGFISGGTHSTGAQENIDCSKQRSWVWYGSKLDPLK